MSQWDLSQPYLYFNREGTDNRLWWHSYPPNMCTRMLSGLTIIALPLNCPEFCIGNPRFAQLLNWQCPTLRGEDLSRVDLHLTRGKKKPTNFLSFVSVTAAPSPLAGWFRLMSQHLHGTVQSTASWVQSTTPRGFIQPFSAADPRFVPILMWEKKHGRFKPLFLSHGVKSVRFLVLSPSASHHCSARRRAKPCKHHVHPLHTMTSKGGKSKYSPNLCH